MRVPQNLIGTGGSGGLTDGVNHNYVGDVLIAAGPMMCADCAGLCQTLPRSTRLDRR